MNHAWLDLLIDMNPVECIYYPSMVSLKKCNGSCNVLSPTRIHWLDQRIVRKQLDVMPTYHYLENQGKLIMQSWENGPKPQFGQFSDDFEVKYLQIANSSEK